MKLQFLNKLPKERIKIYSSLAIVFLLGCILMMSPSEDNHAIQTDTANLTPISFSIENEERRLEALLSKIDGVGECRVLLSVHSGSESVLAEDNGQTLVLKEGSRESIVTVQTIHPSYQGAVIVSGGCSSASVRHNILASVSAYTGLSADKIAICPIDES